jgi:hypothetical protein
VAQLSIDGVVLWTSPPLRDQRARVDAVYIGNLGSVGTGRVLFDDVAIETCDDGSAPLDAGAPDAGGDASPPVEPGGPVEPSNVTMGPRDGAVAADRPAVPPDTDEEEAGDQHLQVGCACALGGRAGGGGSGLLVSAVGLAAAGLLLRRRRRLPVS